jgi:hypothetical protein
MKKKTLICGVIVGALLFALAAVSLAQDIEILEVKYREINRSENYITIAWLVKIQNNTNAIKKAWLKIQFLDADGFQVEYDVKSAALQANTITSVTSTIMIDANIYPQIQSIQASL